MNVKQVTHFTFHIPQNPGCVVPWRPTNFEFVPQQPDSAEGISFSIAALRFSAYARHSDHIIIILIAVQGANLTCTQLIDAVARRGKGLASEVNLEVDGGCENWNKTVFALCCDLLLRGCCKKVSVYNVGGAGDWYGDSNGDDNGDGNGNSAEFYICIELYLYIYSIVFIYV